MSIYLKIFLTWLVLDGILLVCTLMLPHNEVDFVRAMLQAVDLLLVVLCFYLIRNEVNGRNKAIFVNLCILFSYMAVNYSLSSLVQKAFFVDEAYAFFYYIQYALAFYFFIVLFVVAYGVLEVVIQRMKVYQRYLMTLLVAGIPFLYLYHPVFLNAKYLYTTSDILDFKAIDRTIMEWKEKDDMYPAINQIAAVVYLPSLEGTQTLEQKRRRVAEILPYTEDKNYIMLLYKPLDLNAVYMSGLCVILLLAMLGYLYWNDYPRSAFIERILLVFLPYCAFEVLHLYSFFLTVELETYVKIHLVGAILTRCVEVVFLILFVARLNFITSPVGKYYERKLLEDPLHVGRWRDVFDKYVIRHILNSKKFRGRLFSVPNNTHTQLFD